MIKSRSHVGKLSKLINSHVIKTINIIILKSVIFRKNWRFGNIINYFPTQLLKVIPIEWKLLETSNQRTTKGPYIYILPSYINYLSYFISTKL